MLLLFQMQRIMTLRILKLVAELSSVLCSLVLLTCRIVTKQDMTPSFHELVMLCSFFYVPWYLFGNATWCLLAQEIVDS
jgi:hypothetical protein